MAIKAGQLKERADYQAYILEMLENENGYHDQSDYEEGQQIKNHRAVSE